LFASAVAFALLVFFAVGGAHAAPRPLSVVVGTAAGWTVAAAIALFIVFARGRSMLGPPPSRLWTLTLATPLALLGWMALFSARFSAVATPFSSALGMRCLGLTLAMGAWPLLALVLARKYDDPIKARVTGAALGVTVGAAVGVLTDLWCPIVNLPHVALGHILPMGLFASAGVFALSRCSTDT
jgi:hypothetical protein